MKKIVIANNKGGVGKTTIASQLIYELSSAGNSVIAVDLDGQCNLTGTLPTALPVGDVMALVLKGTPPCATLKAGQIGVVEGHADVGDQNADDVMVNVRNGLGSATGAEFCIIDAPPSLGAVVYGAMLAADYLLIPIELKKFSIDGVERVLEAFFKVQEINPDIQLLGILPSRFDAVKETERAALVTLAESFQSVLVPHAIRNRVAYEQAAQLGSSVNEIKSRSGKEASQEFGAFYAWFYDKVKG